MFPASQPNAVITALYLYVISPAICETYIIAPLHCIYSTHCDSF